MNEINPQLERSNKKRSDLYKKLTEQEKEFLSLSSEYKKRLSLKSQVEQYNKVADNNNIENLLSTNTPNHHEKRLKEALISKIIQIENFSIEDSELQQRSLSNLLSLIQISEVKLKDLSSHYLTEAEKYKALVKEKYLHLNRINTCDQVGEAAVEEYQKVQSQYSQKDTEREAFSNESARRTNKINIAFADQAKRLEKLLDKPEYKLPLNKKYLTLYYKNLNSELLNAIKVLIKKSEEVDYSRNNPIKEKHYEKDIFSKLQELQKRANDFNDSFVSKITETLITNGNNLFKNNNKTICFCWEDLKKEIVRDMIISKKVASEDKQLFSKFNSSRYNFSLLSSFFWYTLIIKTKFLEYNPIFSSFRGENLVDNSLTQELKLVNYVDYYLRSNQLEKASEHLEILSRSLEQDEDIIENFTLEERTSTDRSKEPSVSRKDLILKETNILKSMVVSGLMKNALIDALDYSYTERV
mmetsp:Transcript_41628/g.43591  ORF Transcript_41628/g.43591 Transcript_41628/m.43591 type:complete len:470 (+) Transcript_41628:19-1428(+)